MADEPRPCIRCHETPGLDDGYCGHCHWAVKAEIDQGIARFNVYLRHHALFVSWLLEHRREP